MRGDGRQRGEPEEALEPAQPVLGVCMARRRQASLQAG